MCKALTAAGYRLQYSVFAVDLDDDARRDLAARLGRLIDAAEDDVRFYLVPSEPRGAWHGPLLGGDAIEISGAPAADLARRLARQPAD